MDGSGSQLDADRLDGLDSTQFLRSDQNGVVVGNVAVKGTFEVANLLKFHRAEEPPAECNAETVGAIYYNIAQSSFMGCDGRVVCVDWWWSHAYR